MPIGFVVIVYPFVIDYNSSHTLFVLLDDMTEPSAAKESEIPKEFKKDD